MSEFPEKFKNRKEVFEHLKAQGNKISKSKLYDDVAKGLLRVQKDGTVLKKDVEYYLLHPASNMAISQANVSDDAAAKLRLEVEKLEINNEKARLDLDKEKGLYMPKKDFERELAARAAVLDSSLRHMIQSSVMEWIASVAGNPLKAPDLLLLANQSLDRILNEYATTDIFHVVFLGEEN